MVLPLERWAGKRVCLDTNVLIYYLADHPIYRVIVRPLFQAIDAGTIAACVSVITEAELRTLPEAQQDAKGLHALDAFFQHFPHLTVEPVTRAMARRAAQIRGGTRLRLPDALIIATALETDCAAIIGNDAAWKGKTEPCEYVMLRDVEADDTVAGRTT